MVTNIVMPSTTLLPIRIEMIPGVVAIDSCGERMKVNFTNGLKATVVRSPLTKFSHSETETFDVWLPPSREGVAADVAPSKTAEQVVALLNEMAAKAASN